METFLKLAAQYKLLQCCSFPGMLQEGFLLASVKILQTSRPTERICTAVSRIKTHDRENVFRSVPVLFFHVGLDCPERTFALKRTKREYKKREINITCQTLCKIIHRQLYNIIYLYIYIDHKSVCANPDMSTELQEVIYLIEYTAVVEVYRQGFQALEKYR